MLRLFAPLLCLLLASPLYVEPAEAQGATAPRPGSVWTVLTTVRADVVANYATVSVIADIGNRGPDPEFPFRVRIPDDAFVTGLTIERDGVVYVAEVKEREAARREYEQHKAAEQTGGLVEKDRRSSVYSYLVNVAEFTSVRAILTYETYLTAERGIHNLSLEAPVSGFGEDLGARFEVTVRDPVGGVSAAWSAPHVEPQALTRGYRLIHAVGPRPSDAATPFQVSYTLPGTADGGHLATAIRNGTGSFAHVFRAPPDARTLPLDLVLVLDVSGSMQGEKLAQMKDAAVQVVRTLRADDRLHLVFFSSAGAAPWKGLRQMDAQGRLAAADEVSGLIVAGGTNLEAAIRHGFDGLSGVDWAKEEGRMPLVVILTDGQPTEGLTDRAGLRRIAQEANVRDVNVFTIAFGADADWPFLHALARDGEGAALRVPQGKGAEVDLRRFLVALTTPALKDVRVTYSPDGVEAFRNGAPVLFAGSELLILGTYDPQKGAPSGRVTARAVDGLRNYTTESARPAESWLPRLVAYHEIRRLQELIGVEGEKPEWTARVKALALEHGFVTDYTSLVVTLDPRSTPTAAQPGAPAASGQDASSAPRTLVSSNSGAPTTTPPVAAPPSGGTTGFPSSTSPPTSGTGTGGTGGDDPASVSATAPSPEVPGPGVLLIVGALALAAALASASRRKR